MIKSSLNYPKSLILGLVCFLFTGCETDFKENKFDVVKLEQKNYLINKQNGDLFLLQNNKKEPVILEEYKNQILTLERTIGPTKFKFKCKFIAKEQKLIGDLHLIYNKENTKTQVDIDTWKNLLLSGNYNLNIYFQDEDDFTITEEQINLAGNFKYNSDDGYVINISRYLNLSPNLKMKDLSFSYVLPTYEDLNNKFLLQKGIYLSSNCQKLKKELDEKEVKLYDVKFEKGEIAFIPNLINANELIKKIESFNENEHQCSKDIDYNRNLLGQNNYLEVALKAKKEVEKESNDNKTKK